MQDKQRPILNLLATIDGVQYVIGIVRFNTAEFSYFFTYPSGSTKFYNHDTGEPASRFDHITWHDGHIHIKCEDDGAVGIVEYPGPLLTTPPVLTPLYVESLYFKDKPCLLSTKEFTPWKGSSSQELLSLDTPTGFSLIFLLAPAKDSTPQILMGLHLADTHGRSSPAPALADICDREHRAGRISVWKDWDMVVVTTPFVQSTLHPISSAIGPCRLPNYLNVRAALTDLLLQANDLKSSAQQHAIQDPESPCTP
jgi:hypothetical protein